MAVVGCLGEIVFQVSDETVKTINNMQWSGSVRFATHQRHLQNALTEFCGVDPDKMSFEITLMEELGVDPMVELVQLWTYERAGEALPLVIGEKPYGKYRWTILNHKMTAKYHDYKGNVSCVVVAVNLQEYLER